MANSPSLLALTLLHSVHRAAQRPFPMIIFRMKDEKWGEKMFKCNTRIQVRYGETDQMGVAHHGAMVNWLEAARVDWCRKIGVPYREVEAAGFNMAVAELKIRYLLPILFDEEISIETLAEKFGSRLVRFRYRVFNSRNALAAEGITRHLVVGNDLKRASLSPELMARFKAGMSSDA